ncbi:MAG: stage III sporulation protein AF [Oscillospiraceae bacterium]|nr:stage III sporulation protein AF [Oscillospiraceae bacterium]
MVKIRAILLNICFVAAATALFRMLVPENNFKKQISFLISCFFITAVISLVSGADINFDEFTGVEFGSEAGFIDFSEQVTSARKRAVAEELSARVREILEKEEIYPSKIYVIVNISGLYSISINEIRLVLPPEADFTRASALTEREAGRGIKVTIEADTEPERAIPPIPEWAIPRLD